MAKYRNAKPGVLGLSFTNDADKPESGPRVIGPGEVFEAEASEIPEHYLKQGWIVEAGKDERVGPPQLDAGEPARTTADQPLQPQPGQPGSDAQRTTEQQQRDAQQRAVTEQQQREQQQSDDKRHKR